MATQLAPAPPPSHTQTGSGLLDAILRFRALGLIVALIVIVAVTTAVNPRFLSTQSIRDILLATAITLLLAIGLTVVVLTRGIDLSIGSVLGLSAFGVGTLLQNNPGIPVPLAMLAGLLIGAACGLLNAVIVAFGKVPRSWRHSEPCTCSAASSTSGRGDRASAPATCRAGSSTSGPPDLRRSLPHPHRPGGPRRRRNLPVLLPGRARHVRHWLES